jgi:hypothetical protein
MSRAFRVAPVKSGTLAVTAIIASPGDLAASRAKIERIRKNWIVDRNDLLHCSEIVNPRLNFLSFFAI